jgi:putative ABC transport system substrate-binding protein
LASKEHIVRLRALKVRTPEAVMRRRDFITLFGAIAAWPHAAGAQQVRKMPRVGVLWHAGNAEQESDYLPVLTKAFEELGYVEGKSIGLIHRFPAEEPDRFRTYARELVEEKVDAIIAVTPIGAKEAKQATSTIPIVIVLGSDPVGDGLIDSLAHPGGNITGLSIMGVDLSGKRLALLKQAVPTLSRVAIIVDPRDPISQRVVLAYSNAAKSLSLSIQVFDVVAPDDIDSAFVAVAGAGIGAAFIGPGSIMFNERARIGVSARAQKVPTEVVNAQMVKFGPLLSYGQDYPDYFRRAAPTTSIKY